MALELAVQLRREDPLRCEVEHLVAHDGHHLGQRLHAEISRPQLPAVVLLVVESKVVDVHPRSIRVRNIVREGVNEEVELEDVHEQRPVLRLEVPKQRHTTLRVEHIVDLEHVELVERLLGQCIGLHLLGDRSLERRHLLLRILDSLLALGLDLLHFLLHRRLPLHSLPGRRLCDRMGDGILGLGKLRDRVFLLRVGFHCNRLPAAAVLLLLRHPVRKDLLEGCELLAEPCRGLKLLDARIDLPVLDPIFQVVLRSFGPAGPLILHFVEAFAFFRDRELRKVRAENGRRQVWNFRRNELQLLLVVCQFHSWWALLWLVAIHVRILFLLILRFLLLFLHFLILDLLTLFLLHLLFCFAFLRFGLFCLAFLRSLLRCLLFCLFLQRLLICLLLRRCSLLDGLLCRLLCGFLCLLTFLLDELLAQLLLLLKLELPIRPRLLLLQDRRLHTLGVLRRGAADAHMGDPLVGVARKVVEQGLPLIFEQIALDLHDDVVARMKRRDRIGRLPEAIVIKLSHAEGALPPVPGACVPRPDDTALLYPSGEHAVAELSVPRILLQEHVEPVERSLVWQPNRQQYFELSPGRRLLLGGEDISLRSSLDHPALERQRRQGLGAAIDIDAHVPEGQRREEHLPLQGLGKRPGRADPRAIPEEAQRVGVRAARVHIENDREHRSRRQDRCSAEPWGSSVVRELADIVEGDALLGVAQEEAGGRRREANP
mmetsp:Transcript_112752/g.325745  ORF Transcript_112752/g.325745 Transcript_112752/m.325745 type:complete len:715 (+) Transcript_112752:429-2573(+)